MKKNYVTPRIVSEEFAANEYVSACFYIACEYSGETININGHSQRHSATGCGKATNQAITVHSGTLQSGATISITELNAKVLGRPTQDLPCYFVPSEHAQSPRNKRISGVKDGETIYWVTDVGYWMSHKGTVHYTDSNRPNHS